MYENWTLVSTEKKSIKVVPKSELRYAIDNTIDFYKCIVYFSRGGNYKKCPYFVDNTQARVQCYSLVLIFYLWSKPHYRNNSFSEDMSKNLRNVSIPGTGIPLSLCCFFKATMYWVIFIANPFVCLLSAINMKRKFGVSWSKAYVEQLICPKDWFSFWRLNCRLASFHSLVTGSKDYGQEDKWTFLSDGKKKNLPISPFLDIPDIVVKDKNEEGGLGLFFFKNSVNGGDWIIQERLENDSFVKSLLPYNAPLSTLRVITSSRAWMEKNKGNNPGKESVESLSCVFRAGRQDADTDHSSILFDVDTGTGEILKGTENSHWYKMGFKGITDNPWVSTHEIERHPDNNKLITGEIIPDIKSKLEIVRDAHFKMMPDVPFAGWDLAITSRGVFILEVNLSCNFFRGSFDIKSYIEFINEHFIALDNSK